jgi:hypothetical protein
MENQGVKVAEDRRLFERIPVDYPVRFKDYNQFNEGRGFCLDVAAGGMGMFSKYKLAPQDKVDLWLELPDNFEPLNLNGEVIWSNQIQPDTWRTGVKFHNIHLMGLSRIFRLM